jgi:hypothetical protein
MLKEFVIRILTTDQINFVKRLIFLKSVDILVLFIC